MSKNFSHIFFHSPLVRYVRLEEIDKLLFIYTIVNK